MPVKRSIFSTSLRFSGEISARAFERCEQIIIRVVMNSVFIGILRLKHSVLPNSVDKLRSHIEFGASRHKSLAAFSFEVRNFVYAMAEVKENPLTNR